MNQSPRKTLLVSGVFGTACLATVIALLYTLENWRGKRAWDQTRRELEAKGVSFDWSKYIPAAVPDDQNIFKAPHMTEWFVKGDRANEATNELSRSLDGVRRCLASRGSNLVANVTIVTPAAMLDPAEFDAVLNSNSTASPQDKVDPRRELQRVIHRVLGGTGGGSPGPSLKGAQGYGLAASPTNAPLPINVGMRTDTLPGNREITAMFSDLFDTVFPGRTDLRVVPSGSNAFQVFADHRNTYPAADYLECSDLLAPQLEALQQALRRPHARPDGNYDRPWGTPIPGFVAIRNVAQTLSQRAQCYLLLGQPDPALRELTLLYDMRRLLEGKPTTLVSAMIEVAITGLYVNTIADGLRLGAWRESQLAALERQLAAVRLLEPLVAAIEDERVATCRLLEHSSRAELGGILALGPEKRGLWTQLTDPEYLFLRTQPRGWVYQNMASIARFDQWIVEMIDLTNHIVRPQSIDRTAEEVTIRLNRWLPYNFFARQAMPNFTKAVQTTVRNQTLANQGLVACALERYRLVHKEYPASLADLVPGFLAEIPREIINGETLKYRRTSSDHFALYSLGWNERDDGGAAGKAVTDGDWVWE